MRPTKPWPKNERELRDACAAMALYLTIKRSRLSTLWAYLVGTP